MSFYDDHYEEPPAPQGTSYVVSSNRVTVAGHQPAVVPTPCSWGPPHGSVPPHHGCLQYHGPPLPAYNYGHSYHQPYPHGYSLPSGSQWHPPASTCMGHPPPPAIQPQLYSYPPPASTPTRVKEHRGRGGGKKTLPVSISINAPGVASSHTQDQDDIYPGQGSGHVTPGRGQEAVDPVDPGNEQHEDPDSDFSEVNPARFSKIEDMITSRLQAA